MTYSTFIHSEVDAPTTLSEIGRVHEWVEPNDFFGFYAYATSSGVASFDNEIDSDFWAKTPSRWLFGIDYGRTQPQALRKICEKENSEVRVFDGAWVIDQEGFMPRRDFHAKLSIQSNVPVGRFGMVLGSGNFSSNGLRRSIEAGSSFCVSGAAEYARTIEASMNIANDLWDKATPLLEILDIYEERWRDSISGGAEEGQGEENDDRGPKDIFWIEAGYVTKNRGVSRPGNQIDFPRGMSRYFGFNSSEDQDVNTVIGAITFETPIGDSVTRNLRLGNNQMEKITLPIPETHGFDIYDGKILVFQASGENYVMRALEAEDFEKSFCDRLSEIRVMGSGRRYGHIV